MRHYDFVTVGNYTKDTIVSAAGTLLLGLMPGGLVDIAAKAAMFMPR